MSGGFLPDGKGGGFLPDGFVDVVSFYPDGQGGGFSPGTGGTAFTPKAISGLVDWHRSDMGITLVGSKVSAWADQSGNGHDLSQSTDANRPTYESGVLLGKPSVRLTAASSHSMAYSTPWSQPNPAATVFAVLKMQSAPGAIQAFIIKDAAGARLYASVGVSGRAGVHWDGAFRADTGVALDTSPHLIRWQYSAAETRAAQDNTADGTGTAGSSYDTFVDFGSRAGGDQFLNADVFEFAIYNRTLTAGEIQSFEDYSRARYGVP